MAHNGPPTGYGYTMPTFTTATNTITISPTTTWTATTIPNTVMGYPYTIPYTIPNTNTPSYSPNYSTISVDRFGAPSWSDLSDELRPGTAWFQKGAVLRLNGSLFMWKKDPKLTSMHLANSLFVYLGVIEDLEAGQERHWFLAESGEIVQYCYWVCDLSWRGNIKRAFRVVEK